MNIVLANLDDVEESDKQFFEETEDKKFKFSRSKFEEAAKAGLVKKNKELLGKVKDAEKFSKFKDVDDDTWAKFQEWKDAQGDSDDDDSDGDEGKGKGKNNADPSEVKKLIKAELKKAEAAHATALAEKDKAIEAERAKFEGYKAEQELDSEALEAGVIGARLKKFRIAVMAEGIFGNRQGKLVVLDDDGEPTSETAAERMKKLANSDDWKFFFEAKEAGGGSGGRKGPMKIGDKELKRSKMSAKEKSDYIKEHGNDAYFKLPL